jgi:hypothetical protein
MQDMILHRHGRQAGQSEHVLVEGDAPGDIQKVDGDMINIY